MIAIAIIKDSGTGEFAGPGVINITSSDRVHAIEVGALWETIKDGRFERQAKALLEKFCAERGLDAGKLFR